MLDRRHDQSYLFRQGYYGNNIHSPQRTALGWSTDENFLWFGKYVRRIQFFAVRTLKELRSQTRKIEMGSSPGEGVMFKGKPVTIQSVPFFIIVMISLRYFD